MNIKLTLYFPNDLPEAVLKETAKQTIAALISAGVIKKEGDFVFERSFRKIYQSRDDLVRIDVESSAKIEPSGLKQNIAQDTAHTFANLLMKSVECFVFKKGEFAFNMHAVVEA